ncbi:hypothetical protein AB0C34_23725 [Nocardia sp. NPDC049220]|uniref:hypothetical protein n=1 Tax=Nocardia sp. NPDC049220 TaxID=3155273 RepID=UPI003404FD33
MGNYTVVITPDPVGDERDSSDVPHLTIRIAATASDTSRVTDIGINTTAPAGLTSQNVLGIDIEAIVTALARRFTPSGFHAASAGPPASASERNSEQMVLERTSAPAVGNPAPGPSVTDSKGERAYRRMPDISELRATYKQLGTVAAVAKHYGVPRHTAQGWMGRLRRLDQPVEAGSTNNN